MVHLLLDGEPIRAKEAYMNIYKHAKKKIHIIDNYINIKTNRKIHDKFIKRD